MTLNLTALLSGLVNPLKKSALLFTKSLTLQLQRRGVESRVILGGEAAVTAAIDPVLLKAIARGRRWFAELASTRAIDTAAIADHAMVHDSYVRRLLPLAFLAASIVEAICEGRQPPELNTERLTRLRPLPLDWSAQRKLLGLSNVG